MTEQVIENLERIMQAINTNLPVLAARATPEQKQSLLDSQQTATANYKQGSLLIYQADQPDVAQAAFALQKARAAVNASLADLKNVSVILNAFANAVTAGAQIIALGVSV